MTANNPLLQAFDLPSYTAIRPEHVEPAVDRILADNRAAMSQYIMKTDHSTNAAAGAKIAVFI